MNKENLNESTHIYGQIDFQELFFALFDGKWVIFIAAAFFSIIGILYSLYLPNIYQSKAVLVPINSSGNFSQSSQSYGGLANLAGINLSSTGGVPNSVKAIEKISTLSFFEKNILNNIKLADLMAVKYWDQKANTIFYDESIYDDESNTWVTDDPNNNIKPSAQSSFKVFKRKHLSLVEDRNNGFVYLSIKHQSPYIAKSWTKLIVEEINTFYRLKDRLESEKAVNYLNIQISKTALSEIKQVMAQLLQEEIKKLTLIEANQSYVFEYIDPPAVMENKIEPKRSLICILASILGAISGMIIVLFRHYALK